jgi:two-component system chemotaxis response regulator CheY
MGIERVKTADSGLDAIAKLSDDDFDLVVTDLNMLVMDGQQLIQHVRHDMGNTYIPIMIVTSENDAARLSSVQQSGVSAICDKPFEPKSVREILFCVLNDKQKNRPPK